MKATSPLSAGPPDDDIGRGEDGGAHGHDGEAEVVERHGPGLHQLPHQHREHLRTQRRGDDEGSADLKHHHSFLHPLSKIKIC